jgi:ankyrin repeat protein
LVAKGDNAVSEYPLHEAASNGDTETLNRLLAEGVEIESRDDKEATPLLRAARQGQVGAVQHLLKRGADPNAFTPDSGVTVVMAAARAGSAEILRLLLARGADPDQEVTPEPPEFTPEQKEMFARMTEQLREQFGGDTPDPSERFANPKPKRTGRDALMRAVMSGSVECVRVLLEAEVNANDDSGLSPLSMAITLGDAEMVRTLIEHGVDANGGKGEIDLPPLFTAIQHGDRDMARLLLDAGADPNGGATSPLTLATVLNDPAMAELLLEYGAKTTMKEGSPVLLMADDKPEVRAAILSHQGTDWHDAVRAGNVEAVRARLEAGADPNARDDKRQTALLLASERDQGALALAALLLEHGADANAADEYGRTALHHAAQRGDTALAEMLLTHGADLKALNHWRQTPLQLAALNQRHETAIALERAGAGVSIVEAALLGDTERVYAFLSSGTPVNYANESGMTALMAAALRHDRALAADLLARGASVDARDSQGNTALCFAASNPSDQAVPLLELLVARGADVNAADEHGPVPARNAVMSRNTAALRFLLARGADSNAPYVAGNLLHSAMLHDLIATDDFPRVRTLLEFGADVNAEAGHHGPALTEAIRSREIASKMGGTDERLVTLVRLLLEHGAETEKYSTLGGPLDLAIESGIVELVTLILDAGADPNGSGKIAHPILAAESNGYTEIAALLRARGAKEPDDTSWGMPRLLRGLGAGDPPADPATAMRDVAKMMRETLRKRSAGTAQDAETTLPNTRQD